MPTPRTHLSDLPRYVPGRHVLAGGKPPIVLSANENPRGCSPLAQAAVRACADRTHRYPEGNPEALKAGILGFYGVQDGAGEIVLGAGSDEIFSLLTRGFVAPGSRVVISQYGFLMYRLLSLAVEAEPVLVAEQDFRTDVEAILGAIDQRTRMIFLANPNNPTGSYLTGVEVERLVAALPDHVLLVLDEAYSEYATATDYDCHHELVATGRVVVTHTFSKIHGLAGLRLGWGLASPEVADVVERLRSPFNVNSAAISAGIAALEDRAFVRQSAEENDRERRRLAEGLAKLGIPTLPSEGNFLLLRFGSESAAAACLNRLGAGGIIARDMRAYDLADSVRLTIGTPAENDAVLHSLGVEGV